MGLGVIASVNVADGMDNESLLTPGGRLKWARKRAGFSSAAEFSKAARISNVTYRAYENDQNGFRKHAVQFARLLGICIEWLLEGGALPISSVPRPGDARTPDALHNFGIELIRQVDISYAMGDGAVIADCPDRGFIPFDRAFLNVLTRAAPTNIVLANGEGDSMSPTIFDSDLVMIDTSAQRVTMQDRIWALTAAGAGMIKRVRVLSGGKVLILSDNPSVPAQEYDREDICLVGRVVWIGRKM
jgi:phage repressor protein C with HTH and peptisase S24 domain